MKTFEENDWNHMHDCILHATWKTTKKNATRKELVEIFNKMPKDLQGEAYEWGMSDTVWRERFIDWYIKNPENFLTVGNTVYICKVEECWNKPFPMKRHHVYDTRSVILKCVVTDIQGNQFKAILTDNNNFEKDGEEYVFEKNTLLSNQDYTDFEQLGKWKYSS